MTQIIDYYKYTPSLEVAIIVAVLYSLAFLGTAVQFLRYRSWVWSTMVLAAASKFWAYGSLDEPR